MDERIFGQRRLVSEASISSIANPDVCRKRKIPDAFKFDPTIEYVAASKGKADAIFFTRECKERLVTI